MEINFSLYDQEGKFIKDKEAIERRHQEALQQPTRSKTDYHPSMEFEPGGTMSEATTIAVRRPEQSNHLGYPRPGGKHDINLWKAKGIHMCRKCLRAGTPKEIRTVDCIIPFRQLTKARFIEHLNYGQGRVALRDKRCAHFLENRGGQIFVCPCRTYQHSEIYPLPNLPKPAGPTTSGW